MQLRRLEVCNLRSAVEECTWSHPILEKFSNTAFNMLSLDRSLIKTQVILLSWGDIVQSDLEVRNIPVSTEDLSLLNEANAKLQTAVVLLTAENRGLQTSISRLEKTQTVMYE